MISPIRYEVLSDDGLVREVYLYWFDDRKMQLVLDSYTFEERKSKRHGWKNVAVWDRTDKRYNTIQREQIPVRDEVRQAVLKQFVEQITIE